MRCLSLQVSDSKISKYIWDIFTIKTILWGTSLVVVQWLMQGALFRSLVGELRFVLEYVLSCVWVFATLWTVACQASPSMGFSRQGYWSGLPFPSAGDLPDPELKPQSPVSPALASRFFTTVLSDKPKNVSIIFKYFEVLQSKAKQFSFCCFYFLFVNFTGV